MRRSLGAGLQFFVSVCDACDVGGSWSPGYQGDGFPPMWFQTQGILFQCQFPWLGLAEKLDLAKA